MVARWEWRKPFDLPTAEEAARACRNALDETTSKCVEHAKGEVLVDTATLQGSIQMKPAQGTGGRIHAEWGSYGVNYAIYQEIGPGGSGRVWRFRPYLRPARDAEYPKLVGRIRDNLGT